MGIGEAAGFGLPEASGIEGVPEGGGLVLCGLDCAVEPVEEPPSFASRLLRIC